MALQHALPGQAIDVSPLGERLGESESVALFKTAGLEVVRLVLRKGRSMPSHAVVGEITLQCIEGRLVVTAGGVGHPIGAGEMLYLPGGVMHGVVALEDSSALLSIVLRR